MAHISYSENGDNPLNQLLGHNPDLLKNWMVLLESHYQSSILDSQLQEEVRRAVAFQIGCAYCKSHGCPSGVIEDIKTKLAVDFASKVMQLQRQILEADIESLKSHFSEKEISELCSFICYGIGLARFGAVLNVDAMIEKSSSF